MMELPERMQMNGVNHIINLTTTEFMKKKLDACLSCLVSTSTLSSTYEVIMGLLAKGVKGK